MIINVFKFWFFNMISCRPFAVWHIPEINPVFGLIHEFLKAIIPITDKPAIDADVSPESIAGLPFMVNHSFHDIFLNITSVFSQK